MKIPLLVLIVIALTMLATGCTSSTQETQQQPSNVNTPTSAMTPAQTQETSTLLTYQDKEWGNAVTDDTSFLQADLTAIDLAEQYNNYDNMITAGQALVNDTNIALSKNGKYNLSPKYQEAEKEWVASLQDFNKAGQALIQRGQNGRAGRVFSKDKEKEESYLLSGTSHLGRCVAYLENTQN